MRERVLIVDDDPVQRRLLEHAVRTLGCEPAFAASEDGAIAALADQAGPRIDAVVLDLLMPGRDGLGVLSRLRAAGIGVPVIVLTTPGATDAVIAAIGAGATEFADKPVGAERLQVSLRNALAARALERELARIKRGRARAVGLAQVDTTGIQEFPIASRVTDFVPSASVAPELATCAAASAPSRTVGGSSMVTEAGHDVASLAAPVATRPAGVIALLDGSGNMRPLEEIEAETIRFAISHYRGQMSEVARRLRIGRSTLYRKLDSLELDAGLTHTEAPAL
jgi:DNA-binding NtrC family response regulator